MRQKLFFEKNDNKRGRTILFLTTSLFFLLSSITGCFKVKSSKQFSYTKLSPTDYAQMLKDSSGYCLIDVRTEGEYKKAHIPGAINISYLNFNFGEAVDSISRNKLIFVYCHTCHRSPLAAKTLRKKGFRKVYDLEGGFQNSPWDE